jgi:hypothetical protein
MAQCAISSCAESNEGVSEIWCVRIFLKLDVSKAFYPSSGYTYLRYSLVSVKDLGLIWVIVGFQFLMGSH